MRKFILAVVIFTLSISSILYSAVQEDDNATEQQIIIEQPKPVEQQSVAEEHEAVEQEQPVSKQLEVQKPVKSKDIFSWSASTTQVMDRNITINGHAGTIWNANFSPDSTKIATASSDNTAKVWDVNKGNILLTLSGHMGDVNCVSYSPDGSKIVTASSDNTARIWDSVSASQLATLSGHTYSVRSAYFSPDGKKIATSSGDDTARIWDSASASQLIILSGHSSTVWTANFSPDGSKIVTASSDKTARIWDAYSGALLLTLSGHGDKVTSAIFSPDGTKIATASEDKTARIWDAYSGALLLTLSGHGDKVTSASFSYDNTRMVTSSNDKTARIWDACSGTLLATLSGHGDKVTSACFSRDGSKIITSSSDKTSRVWVMPSGHPFENLAMTIDKELPEFIKQKSKKDDFESSAEHAKRVANLQNSTGPIKAEMLSKCISSEMGNPKLVWETYNADEKKLYLSVVATGAKYSKQISFSASTDEARKLKESIDTVSPKIYFSVDNNNAIEMEDIELLLGSKVYTVSTDGKLKVDYKIAQNDKQQKPSSAGSQNLSVSSQSSTDDDLAPLVSSAKQNTISSKNWIFAIAVENYDEADKVVFAKKSAEMFVAIAQKRFGVDARHTYANIDEKATATALTDKLDKFVRNVNDGDTIYFYYSGHGIPSPDDGEAYFLPKDKMVDFALKEKELMASKIYEKLSSSKAGKVVAFVDACFSGRTDNVMTIKGVAPGLLKSKKIEFDKSKMVVMTAGSSKQFSNSYDEKEHRMFSYFLIKNLAENENIDLDLLYKKTAVQVKEASYKKGDTYVQEPQIDGNVKLGF